MFYFHYLILFTLFINILANNNNNNDLENNSENKAIIKLPQNVALEFFINSISQNQHQEIIPKCADISQSHFYSVCILSNDCHALDLANSPRRLTRRAAEVDYYNEYDESTDAPSIDPGDQIDLEDQIEPDNKTDQDDEPSTPSTLRFRGLSQDDDSKCFLLQYNVHSSPDNNTHSLTPKRSQVWGFGFLSVAIISLSGIMGIIFIPIMKQHAFQILMRYLVGLGVGTLSSTAVFQLIPESFELKKNSQDYLLSSLIIWLSIWIFFMFESICKIVLNCKEKRSNRDGHKSKQISRKNSTLSPPALEAIEHDSFLPVSADARWQRSTEESQPKLMINDSVHGSTYNIPKPIHHRSHDLLAAGDTTISSVAWMIVFGDGLHNFIDGVSIGAGFSESIMTGFSISLAIMCEEFPHELGDFAILINSGMSVKKAVIFNFASACTAFAGLVLGISLEKLEINSYIFGFAGGLFIYISLADLIPQLNEMVDTALNSGTKSACYVLIQQNLGVLSGMIILFLITRFSDDIKIG